MYTENGRKDKAENKEVSSALTRKFVCLSCGEKANVKSKQFGEEVKCSACDNIMSEVKE